MDSRTTDVSGRTDGAGLIGLEPVPEAAVYCLVPTTDSGLSARVGADQLGHARPSMTQDVYMARGRIHTEVAAVLDRAVGISDE